MKRTASMIAIALAGVVPALAGCAAGPSSSATGAGAAAPSAAACAGAATLATAASTPETLVLLTDERSPDFSRVVGEVAADPKRAFASSDLALSGRVGTVEIMTYDAAGQVTPVVSYDLAGSGYGLNRSASATATAACLKQAAAEMPAGPGGGDVLQALPRAVRYSTSPQTGIIVFGLGRASGSGLKVSTAVLDTPAARSYVDGQLAKYGLIPNLGGDNASVLFLDPAEGLQSGITASGVEAFASSLCPQMGAVHCATDSTLR